MTSELQPTAESLLVGRGRRPVWLLLHPSSRVELERLFAVLWLQQQMPEIDLLLEGAGRWGSVVPISSAVWSVTTDLSEAVVQLQDSGRFVCSCTRTPLVLCVHTAAVQLWLILQPVELNIVLDARGWTSLVAGEREFRSTRDRFERLSPSQQELICRWLRTGSTTTLRKVFKGLRYYTDGQVKEGGGGICRVEHDGARPWQVDTNVLDGCGCERCQGQGQYADNAGLCAHQVAAALQRLEHGVMPLV